VLMWLSYHCDVESNGRADESTPRDVLLSGALATSGVGSCWHRRGGDP
jgi:hypothetical protein